MGAETGILAFAHDTTGKLVPVAFDGPRIRTPGSVIRLAPGRSSWLGGHLVHIAGECAIVLYLPEQADCGRGECGCVERHRAELLAALGRCNACACLLDGHSDDDRAACAEILAQIAEDEAAEARRS